MTHSGWQGSGGAGPGPRAPARSRCRPGLPSLPCRPNPLEARGCGSALRPWDLAARTPIPCFCDHSWALGKLLGPKRREGRKGRERRRRGPGGQQPQPAGELSSDCEKPNLWLPGSLGIKKTHRLKIKGGRNKIKDED
nr:uncharacterized protein LOC745508 [Pan troglodytes]